MIYLETSPGSPNLGNELLMWCIAEHDELVALLM